MAVRPREDEVVNLDDVRAVFDDIEVELFPSLIYVAAVFYDIMYVSFFRFLTLFSSVRMTIRINDSVASLFVTISF